ncbi:MAG: hypothetical protein ABR515_08240 [Nitrososphaeraceae archaeon]
MIKPNHAIAIMLCSIFTVLVLDTLNPYHDMNFQNSYIYGQENGALISSENTSTSANISGIMPGDNGQLFTISCNDFKKLFDALSALNIGNEVSENSINQTILDDVENIFNIYAGKCSQLDEYEFE